MGIENTDEMKFKKGYYQSLKPSLAWYAVIRVWQR